MEPNNTPKRANSSLRLKNASGKTIATVQIDLSGRLYSLKLVDATRHFLAKPPAIAYDTCALQEAGRLRVQYHRVKDERTGYEWCAEHYKFERFGRTFNRGYGEQVMLELKHWHQAPEPPPVTVAMNPLYAVEGGTQTDPFETQFTLDFGKEAA